MEQDRDNGISETTSEFLQELLTDEQDGDVFALEYLKASFLSSAIDALFDARRRAGLTQGQVAEQLKTKQSAVARWEADTTGSMSLRRYIEFALACGVIPLDITLAPVDSIRKYVQENPGTPKTIDMYKLWFIQNNQSVPTLNGPIEAGANTVLSLEDMQQRQSFAIDLSVQVPYQMISTGSMSSNRNTVSTASEHQTLAIAQSPNSQIHHSVGLGIDRIAA